MHSTRGKTLLIKDSLTSRIVGHFGVDKIVKVLQRYVH
jgi:hypothetical protein